ncbi:DddA-like double-stranded DNA deaminase toxin [Kitasatospora sp. NPDC088351]|uniref:DddA-like double-stranded DNA deaminase toxin n=1 Tax=Kitasatospora sp. NPDC088351 TaxID=3155180 RepID=UPI003449E6AA
MYEAQLVINMPGGPCREPLGCDQLLNFLLGPDKGLTVYFPRADGNGLDIPLRYGTAISKG